MNILKCVLLVTLFICTLSPVLGFNLLYENFNDLTIDTKHINFNVERNLATTPVDAWYVGSINNNVSYVGNSTTERIYVEYNTTESYNWTEYEYKGKMQISQNNSKEWGFGIIINSNLSLEPTTNLMYELYYDSTFVNGFLFTSTGSTLDLVSSLYSFVTPTIGDWYNFRIQTRVEYNKTVLGTTGTFLYGYANVWKEGNVEPSTWLMNLTDYYNEPIGEPTHIKGSIGFMSYKSKSYFDDIIVQEIFVSPVITVNKPTTNVQDIGTLDLNITIDKETINCTYNINSITYNMIKDNLISWSATANITSFGIQDLTFSCIDTFNNVGTTIVSIEIIQPQDLELIINQCPATIEGQMLLWLVVIISFMLFALLIISKVGVFGLISGIGLMVCSWYIVGCSNLMGWIVALSGIMIIVWTFTR